MQRPQETLATPLLTPAEAAQRCRVSRAHIYRLIAREDVPAVRVGERGPLRIAAPELEQWLFGTHRFQKENP
jgi:excisionase family DNA binding protein